MSDMQTSEIHIPYPEAQSLNLKITVGACALRVSPGDQVAWVTGTYRHPAALPHKIEEAGGTVKITQEQKGWLGPFGDSAAPCFDLALGKAKPYTLAFKVGASDNKLDLGGLPLNRLMIKQGAGKGLFDFAAPNPQPMSLLDLDAGAVSIEMRNLANANFGEMRVNGGAAAYRFDFGGALQRDAHVHISTGMASIELIVPGTTAARITMESFMASLDVGDGFMKKEGAFWTQGALEGNTPTLQIHANVTMGSLKLRTS
ncbi:MAG: hypothetical protein KKA73_31340 [Chloroflexi bacterium]|nr:hypothetical protein [Chloroflexota bacterium]MBU1752197.1 hypothetical protein [Chloroflexota bacterium]